MIRLICASENIYLEEFSANDKIICVDGGLTYAIERGLKVDFVIGDFDSLHSDVYKKYNFKKLNVKKDDTDLRAALNEVLKYDEEIYIYGATGGRLDHFLAAVNDLALGNIHLIDKYNHLFVSSGDIAIPNDKYEYFSVYTFAENSIISIENAEYVLNDYLLKKGDSLCTSNVAYDNCKVSSTEKVIIVLSKNK